MTAENGFVPTPTAVADEVALRLLTVGKIEDASLLYPGAGRGHLFAAAQRVCHVRDKPLPECVAVEKTSARTSHLQERFDADTGVQTTPALSGDSRRALRPAYPPSAQAQSRPLGVEVNIRNGDFLAESFEQQFDYVIANPPYTRYRELDSKKREAYSKRFQTAVDSFSLAAPFVEHTLNQLRAGGQFGFILPEGILTKGYMASLRNRLREECISEVVVLPEPSFPDHTIRPIAIFGEATATPDRNGHFWVEALSPYKPDVEQFLSRVGIGEHNMADAIDTYRKRVQSLQTLLRTLRHRDGADGGYNIEVIPRQFQPEHQAGLGEWTS